MIAMQPVLIPDRERHEQIDRIVKSQILKQSKKLCELLKYLVDKAINPPQHFTKERDIATQVFGKDERFDPTLDNTVRIHIGRLRERLRAYYASIGQKDSIVAEIPKGRYAVVFRKQEIAAPLERPAAAPPRQDGGDEDPFPYLPRKPVQEYARNRIIYDVQHPATNLYLMILGRVKIGTTADDGGQTVSRIVRSEGLFGESSLIGPLNRSETAIALDAVTLMSWSRHEIERQVEREPRLGIALAQYLVRQCIELQDRIESMAVHKTPERVMLALLQLAADFGSPMPDGSMRVAFLTHHTIAEFVGTSREIVTFQMNRLRRMGLLRYSRKHMDVYAQALRENLRQRGMSGPHGAKGAAQIVGG